MARDVSGEERMQPRIDTIPSERPPRDWSYRSARRRLVRAGRAALPRHTAAARMDARANRIVECGCGWTGNGLGWAEHIDQVVRLAIHE